MFSEHWWQKYLALKRPSVSLIARNRLRLKCWDFCPKMRVTLWVSITFIDGLVSTVTNLTREKSLLWTVSCPFFLLCSASCLPLFLDSLWCLDHDISKNFIWLFLWRIIFLHLNFYSHTAISFIFTRRFSQILRLFSPSIPVQRIKNSDSLLSLWSSKGN